MFRGSTWLVVAIAAVAFATIAGWARMADPASLAGETRVIDGDSLRIAGREVRLHGIDAPELNQTCDKDGKSLDCGRVAKAELARLIDGRPVQCRVFGRDRFGRAVALCEAGGASLNAAMVEKGHAVAFGAFEAEQARAKADKRGVWAMSFDPPREWRAKHERSGK